MDTEENLQNKREEITTKIFLLAFQTIFIFGIPAVIGVIIGLKLDAFYKTNRTITIIILVLTFIFSWVIVIVKYRSLNKKIKEIESNKKNTNQ